jgi:hypothetical protein
VLTAHVERWRRENSTTITIAVSVMQRHFIHYIRRQVRLVYSKGEPSPWFAEMQADVAGLQGPKYHVTRSISGAAVEVEACDIIWLIGQLYSPWGHLPPAIDARIDVAVKSEIRDQRGHLRGYRFQAAETSPWFPLADATELLGVLETQDRKGRISPLREQANRQIGQFLQRMRRLNSGDPLVKWESELKMRGFEFVSYRVCDGTHAAFNKVKSIVDTGRSVFWDRWSLPRRLAERREKLQDPALEAQLHEQIRQAAIVWGIESPLYGQENSYSHREMTLAKTLGKFRVA